MNILIFITLSLINAELCTLSAVKASDCITNWTYASKNMTIFFSKAEQTMNEEEARRYCDSRRLHILSSRDLAQSNFIENEILPNACCGSKGECSLWLGLKSLSRSCFWSDGTLCTWENWPSGSSDSCAKRISRVNKCAIMAEDGLWDTALCKSKMHVVCEHLQPTKDQTKHVPIYTTPTTEKQIFANRSFTISTRPTTRPFFKEENATIPSGENKGQTNKVNADLEDKSSYLIGNHAWLIIFFIICGLLILLFVVLAIYIPFTLFKGRQKKQIDSRGQQSLTDYECSDNEETKHCTALMNSNMSSVKPEIHDEKGCASFSGTLTSDPKSKSQRHSINEEMHHLDSIVGENVKEVLSRVDRCTRSMVLNKTLPERNRETHSRSMTPFQKYRKHKTPDKTVQEQNGCQGTVNMYPFTFHVSPRRNEDAPRLNTRKPPSLSENCKTYCSENGLMEINRDAKEKPSFAISLHLDDLQNHLTEDETSDSCSDVEEKTSNSCANVGLSHIVYV